MCKLSYNLLAPIPALSAVRWEINCLGWQEWMRKRQWRTAPLLQACMWANKPLPLYVMPPRGWHTVSESSAALPHCKSLSAQAWRLLPEEASPKHSHYLQRHETGLSTHSQEGNLPKLFLRKTAAAEIDMEVGRQPTASKRKLWTVLLAKRITAHTCLEPFTAEVTRLSSAELQTP